MAVFRVQLERSAGRRSDECAYVIVVGGASDRKWRHNDEGAGASTGAAAASARLGPAPLPRAAQRRRQATSGGVSWREVPRCAGPGNTLPARPENRLSPGMQLLTTFVTRSPLWTLVPPVCSRKEYKCYGPIIGPHRWDAHPKRMLKVRDIKMREMCINAEDTAQHLNKMSPSASQLGIRLLLSIASSIATHKYAEINDISCVCSYWFII